MCARPERSWKVSHADVKGKGSQAEGARNVKGPKPGLSEQREVSGAERGKESVENRVRETTGGQTTEHLVDSELTLNCWEDTEA